MSILSKAEDFSDVVEQACDFTDLDNVPVENRTKLLRNGSQKWPQRHRRTSDTHPHTLESLNNLIDLYKAWDKPEKAEQWRAKLLQAEAVKE